MTACPPEFACSMIVAPLQFNAFSRRNAPSYYLFCRVYWPAALFAGGKAGAASGRR